MKTVFHDKKISGILLVLPEQEILFEDEVNNYSFPLAQTMRLKKVMGYSKHRIAKPTTSTSDLCVYGLKHLLDTGRIAVDEIGAVIVLTITPDHFVPHVSNIIQGECGLQHDVLCMDISQGCCGFLLGLIQSFMLLEHLNNKKVVLFNADVLSHKVSKRDRNSYPIVGDAATVTIVENAKSARDIFVSIDTDGTKRDVLKIDAGGSRLPCSPETAEMKDDGEGNYRCLDNLRMDGSQVFSFVQTAVPPLIHETLDYAGLTVDDIDWYIFHQPNKFMLQKLADRIGIPRDKVFMNIVENYGNPSGASIPMAITHNLANEMIDRRFLCCLSAFGGGLSWGAMTIELGEMDFCEMLVSDC